MLRRREQGFTLAELMVATMLMTVVMICVYTAFNTSVRSWRQGESNRAAYQDARIAMGLISRDLQSMVSGAGYLFEGKHDEFEFFTIGQPMDVEHGEGNRTLWVRYRIKTGSRKEGSTLLREEAQVEGAMPIWLPGQKEDEMTSKPIKMGRKEAFELVKGVKELEIRYLWVPTPPKLEIVPGEPLPSAPEPVEPVEEDAQRKGWGRPQAVRIELTVEDPLGAKGLSTFAETVVFHGPTRPYEDRIGEEKGES